MWRALMEPPTPPLPAPPEQSLFCTHTGDVQLTVPKVRVRLLPGEGLGMDVPSWGLGMDVPRGGLGMDVPGEGCARVVQVVGPVRFRGRFSNSTCTASRSFQ